MCVKSFFVKVLQVSEHVLTFAIKNFIRGLFKKERKNHRLIKYTHGSDSPRPPTYVGYRARKEGGLKHVAA